ncbi:hypothetical protein DI53_3871 [Sphingobacterium deserti]|uniref:Uncharacterized protein n=1 Tax=Sphingobacterium deserti TaxID=1229276 RepID=A0A0B8SYM6_9SPHI|nr:hypothetical protein DI53_3871 [Sphingobacterium deserti]
MISLHCLYKDKVENFVSQQKNAIQIKSKLGRIKPKQFRISTIKG